MQALTVPNVRSAMIAMLRKGPLPMAKLFAAVMREMDVAAGDDEKRDVAKNTVVLLLDGHTFIVVRNKSGKEKIAYRPPPTLPIVRSAMIAVLRNGPLTMANLLVAVLRYLGVSLDDDEDRDTVEYTVMYLLDGNRFDIILGESGKETIKYYPLAASAKRRKK